MAVFNSSSEVASIVLGGHVDVQASPGAAVILHAQSGKLGVLVVAAPTRQSGALADVPTWTEQGLNEVSANWRNVVGPQGMRAEQIQYWDGVFAKLGVTGRMQKKTSPRIILLTLTAMAPTRAG